MNELIVQAIGLVAIIIGLASFQMARRSQILLLQIVASALWVVHFGLLGAMTGALLNVVSTVRTIVFYRFRQQRHRVILYAMLVLVVVATALTWQGWESLLAALGFVLFTIALWQRNEQRMRVIALISVVFWLSYDAIVGSYAGVFNELLLAGSLVIALVRHRRD